MLMFDLQHPDINTMYVLSYYNSKLTAYASSITGILSKMAALLFATMNKTNSALNISEIKQMYTHIFQLELSSLKEFFLKSV